MAFGTWYRRNFPYRTGGVRLSAWNRMLPGPRYTIPNRTIVRRSYRPTTRRYLRAPRRISIPRPMYGGMRPQAGNPYGLEYKHYVFNAVTGGTGTTLLSNVCELTLLNALPQGPGATQRVGNEITMKRVQVNGYLWNLRGTTQASSLRMPNQVRVGLLLDTQPAGAQAATSSTFPLPALIWTTTSPPLPMQAAMRNYLNTDRFKILKSKTYYLNGDVATNGAYSYQGKGFDQIFKLGVKIPDYKVSYASSDQIIRSGSAIYLFVMTGQNDVGTGTNAHANLTYSANGTVTFVDS